MIEVGGKVTILGKEAPSDKTVLGQGFPPGVLERAVKIVLHLHRGLKTTSVQLFLGTLWLQNYRNFQPISGFMTSPGEVLGVKKWSRTASSLLAGVAAFQVRV